MGARSPVRGSTSAMIRCIEYVVGQFLWYDDINQVLENTGRHASEGMWSQRRHGLDRISIS